MDAPRPEGDGAGLLVGIDERPQPAARLLAVGVEVADVERGDGVTTIDRLVDGPDVLRLPAGRVGGEPAGVHPGVGQADLGVVYQRVVALEVRADEHRGRPLARV